MNEDTPNPMKMTCVQTGVSREVLEIRLCTMEEWEKIKEKNILDNLDHQIRKENQP